MQKCGIGAGNRASLNKELSIGKAEPQLLMNVKKAA